MFYLNGLTDNLAANATLTGAASSIKTSTLAANKWNIATPALPANPAIGINSQISSKLAGAIGNTSGSGWTTSNTNPILSKQFESAVKLNEKFKNFWNM